MSVTKQSKLAPVVLWSLSDLTAEQDCACASQDVPPTGLLWSLPGEYAENDCACPSFAFAPHTTLDMPAALWQSPSCLYRAPLPGAHELAFNPADPIGVAVLNEPARHILDTFATPRPLTDVTAHQLAALGLLTSNCVSQHATRTLRAQHVLIAWLHITNQCNLRCVYCYAPRNKGVMNAEIGRAAVDAVIRSASLHGFRAIKLKYAGGEPTLNFSVVQATHAHAQTLAARHNLELHAVLLSNGTMLTDEMLGWLGGEGVRLMISLDGTGAMHDAQRPFVDGRGSFAQVVRHIDRALAQGLVPYLSITVTAHNISGLADAVAFALGRDLPFNLNFVRDLGLAASHQQANQAGLIAGIQAAFAVIEATLPRRRLIDALLDRSAFAAPHEYPCGAGRNYLVIDPQGRVARCQMAMDQTVADVWADDPLQAVRGPQAGFQNVSVDEKEGCRECVWRYWCAGGCPLLAYRATGRSDRPSPYCAAYQALYPSLLRLEGLRLLKWQPSPG